MGSHKTKLKTIPPSICPVSGLPVTRRPEWTDIDLGNGHAVTFEFIGDRFLLSRSKGLKTADRQSVKQLFRKRKKVLDRMIGKNEPFVELKDYCHFNGLSSKEARNQFIHEMEADRDRIIEFIGFNAPKAIKIVFSVWGRLFQTPFPISIVKDYKAALDKALSAGELPGEKYGRPNRTIVKFPQNTYRSDNYSIEYEIIDNRILHTIAAGILETGDVGPSLENTRRVSESVEKSDRDCFVINGVNKISGSRYKARLKYLEGLQQWHADFPHFKMMIFYGANRWVKAGIQMLKHLVPLKVKIVDDLESAITFIKMLDTSRRNRPEIEDPGPPSHRLEKKPPLYPGPAHEILEYLGNVSMGTGNPGIPPPPENIDSSFGPVYDAISLIKMDLDELEEERKRSRNERLILATAIEQSTDSISITDFKGKILYINPAFTQITGYRQDEATGRHISFISHNREAIEKLDALWKAVSPGRAVTEQITCNKKDGTSYIADTTVSQIVNNDKKIRNFVITQRDVTHEVRLEAQLKQMHKMEAIGTLAGGIAHDFNNILFPIIGYTEMSMDEVAPGSQLSQNLKEILQAATRAKQLVKQILTFSKQDSTTRKPIRLVPVMEEAVSLLRASIPSTIEIKQVYGKNTGLVLADPTQIHQVIVNLGSNAFHAMRETGGVITISLKKFQVTGTAEKDPPAIPPGDYLKLSVTDTGHGISPEIRNRIFDPFFTTKEVATNTGLGLSLTHSIVTGHDGLIQVSSEPGRGTTFDIYLPEIQSIVTLESTSPVEQTDSMPEGRGHILVVDDELQSVEIIDKILRNLGYQTTSFTDSPSALDYFRKNPGGIDLVITDQVMSKLTGDALAEAIVRINPEIPVIICTGYREMLENTNTGTIREILAKPVSRNDLARAAQRALSGRLNP